jgi:hydrogenase/urease accessory protein HupE
MKCPQTRTECRRGQHSKPDMRLAIGKHGSKSSVAAGASRGLGLLFCAVLLGTIPAHAHTSLPGYLVLHENSPGLFDLAWKVPTAQGPPPAIYPIFPATCSVTKPLVTEPTAGAIIERGSIECGAKGLNGESIEISGLSVTILDVLVRVDFADGTSVQHMLKPIETSFVVHKDGKNRIDIWGYVGLGVGHILYGIDHLLFVLGLLLIVRGPRLLLKTITAFTVAHTITLGMAVFGVAHVAPTPVEAVIALSIVFLAVELAQYQRGKQGLTYRQPWIVAFAFGLLHGFGFAGTLSQLGIPSGDIPRALLFFNLGVESGQLLFVAVFLSFVYSLRSLEIHWPAWTERVPAYALGSVASFWLIQRCAIIF